MSYEANVSEGKNIKKPSLRMTQNRAEHEANGTTGEDFAEVGRATTKGFLFTAPCSGGVRVPGSGKAIKDTKSGMTFVMEAFHYEIYGIKFTEYCNHTENRKAGAPQDTYSFHIHVNYNLGHLTMDEAYAQRNTSMSFDELDKYIGEHKSGSTPPKEETPAPKEYVEAVRKNKDSYNGTFKFDVKYYEELKDLCNQKDIVDLDKSTWKAGTTWTSVKKVGSSSTTYTKVKVTRSGKSKDNGTFYFPLSAWEDINDNLTLSKATDDCNGVTWGANTTFNTAVRV